MATRIGFAPEVVDDFDRVIDHLVRHGVADAAARIEAIVAAIDTVFVLATRSQSEAGYAAR